MARAGTVAGALAQELTVPPCFDDAAWRALAGTIDGYAIARELGFGLLEWGMARERAFPESGRWDLDVLGPRLVLFYLLRLDHRTGYTYHEQDDGAESVLAALAEATGQPCRRRV